MWDPPATIECTRVNTLRPGRNPPTRPARRTVESVTCSNPKRTTSVPTNSSPALATKFVSSKCTRMRSRPRDTRFTGSASRAWGRYGVSNRIVPAQEALSADGPRISSSQPVDPGLVAVDVDEEGDEGDRDGEGEHLG